MDTKPISKFSESICKKVPASRWDAAKENALWILRNPVRLTTEEKQEVVSVIVWHDLQKAKRAQE